MVDRSDRSRSTSSRTSPAVLRCCAGSVQCRSNPANTPYIRRIIRLSPGNMMSKTIQTRIIHLPCLADLHHAVGIHVLSGLCKFCFQPFIFRKAEPSRIYTRLHIGTQRAPSGYPSILWKLRGEKCRERYVTTTRSVSIDHTTVYHAVPKYNHRLDSILMYTLPV